MTRVRSVLLGILITLAASSPVMAQSAGSDQAGMPRVNLISTNPIGIIFEWFNAEVEHAVSPTLSLAVAASRFEFDETITVVDGIARYYPTARAIRGFSFGGSVGYAGVTNDCSLCENNDDDTAFTVGVRGDYVWILGRDQRFAVAGGIGAKRLFYSKDNTFGPEGLPIGRLSVGYAW
ncbi:MAG: DUF3575 domain-containing protein [Gemmatimonadaceae bacterium]|nr:DUF3575 domain-containing protein [Gemmatimonadaceae bacterium]